MIGEEGGIYGAKLILHNIIFLTMCIELYHQLDFKSKLWNYFVFIYSDKKL